MNNNKEKLIEVNDKIKELQFLINEAYKEENNTDKTLIDFFQPILGRMLIVIADNVSNSMKYKDSSPNDVRKMIINLDPNSILATCQTDIEGKQEWEDEVKRLVGVGYKLQAVKYMKETTGLGLKECKDYIDQLK